MEHIKQGSRSTRIRLAYARSNALNSVNLRSIQGTSHLFVTVALSFMKNCWS